MSFDVCSTNTGLAFTEAFELAAIGYAHFGQHAAALDTSTPHSGHLIKAIEHLAYFPFSFGMLWFGGISLFA